MMELAWMVHPWLARESALPLLLENVASTLLGVEMAWGLTRALFDSKESFHAAAESWQPRDFAEQYAKRMVLFRDSGRLAAQASFWHAEAVCRRLIAESAMTSDDLGPRRR